MVATLAEVPKALRDALEPGAAVTKHPAYLRRPIRWETGTLYSFYDSPPQYRQVESDPSCQRLEFSVRIVYIVDRRDEEPMQELTEAVDDQLATKADTWAGILAARTGIPHSIAVTSWATDPAYLSNFNEAGLAVLITGFRLP